MLELANIIGNITSALNYELKSTTLKVQRIQELEMHVEKARTHSQAVIEQNEKAMQSGRVEIEQAAERKVQRFKELTIELEKVNKDLLAKADRLSKVNKSQENSIGEKENQINGLHG